MGCGKTTLGRAVAERARVRFVDLDHYVEAQAGMSVREIFERHGEAHFRTMERAALRELTAAAADLDGEQMLIACGGGTPCQPGNMELMNECGITVMLDAPVERLHERLIEGAAQRPLIAALSAGELRERIIADLERRGPHYALAAERFDSSRLDNLKQVEETSRCFINRFINIS